MSFCFKNDCRVLVSFESSLQLDAIVGGRRNAFHCSAETMLDLSVLSLRLFTRILPRAIELLADHSKNAEMGPACKSSFGQTEEL